MSYEIDKNLKEVEGTLQTALAKKNKTGTAIFPFKHSNLAKIQYVNPDFLLTLTVSCDLEKSKLPDWLILSKKGSGWFEFTFPEGYENELVFLLLEMYEEEEKSGNVEPLMESVFNKWCKLMKAKEPFSVSDQKGIMGEIACILAAVINYKDRAVIGWDRSNLRDIQITDVSKKDLIHIESKSHSPSASSITISARNQLKYCADTPPVVLGVSLIQRSLSGQTLPDYVQYAINEIRKTSSTSSSIFENHDIIKRVLKQKNKFRSKFQLISIEFYKVKKSDKCNEIANLPLPIDTDFVTWYLTLPLKMTKYVF